MGEEKIRREELTCQAAEATVPKASVLLNVLQFFHVKAQLKIHQWISNSNLYEPGPEL